MNASAWGAGDFEAGLSEAIGQARKLFHHVYGAAGMPWEGPGGPGHGHHPGPDEEPEGHGHYPGQESHEHHHGHGFGQRRTAPAGGPWGGFGAAKDWMGFFGGPRGGWWPGPPGPRHPHGGPGWARRPKASRGDVRATILALLGEGPRTGYQIMSDIEERSGGAWRPSPGAVYPALQQLADEGLIIGEEAGGRRTFSLTDAGRGYVADNPEMARGAWESMGHAEAGELPGLFTQAARLGAAIAQMAHAGTPEQMREAERLLEQTRRRLYQLLADDDTDDDQPGGAAG
jgi:DNA-binding PadR family transcriptional regulator